MKILVHYLAFNSNQAFEYTANPVTKSTEHLLEFIFRDCNVVDGSEWVVRESKRRIEAGERGLRSMSVGDIVTLIDEDRIESYLCAGIGWTKLG